MPRRRADIAPRYLGLRLALAALLSAGLFALTAPGRAGDEPGSLSVALADGTLSHDNSRDGSAILSATGVWPGWSGQGDVTIANDGTAGSWLRRTEASVADAPGPAGGILSQRMTLVVEDVTVAGFPVAVYTGTLGAVGERWLGRMEAGETRTYRFSTAMPSLAGDNDYQSSAVNVRFDWAVSDTEPGSLPPVDPPAGGGGGGTGGGDSGGGGSGGGGGGGGGGGEPAPSDPVPPTEEPAPDTPPEDEPDIVVVPDGPPVVVVNRTKLSVKLAVPTAQRPLQRRNLLTLASCSRSCRATIGGRIGTVSSGAGGMAIGSVSRALSAGIQERVTLRLSKRTLRTTRRLLAAGKAVRGQIHLVARDRSGRMARATQKIRLVPARR